MRRVRSNRVCGWNEVGRANSLPVDVGQLGVLEMVRCAGNL
jgi:hypothetical protein